MNRQQRRQLARKTVADHGEQIAAEVDQHARAQREAQTKVGAMNGALQYLEVVRTLRAAAQELEAYLREQDETDSALEALAEDMEELNDRYEGALGCVIARGRDALSIVNPDGSPRKVQVAAGDAEALKAGRPTELIVKP